MPDQKIMKNLGRFQNGENLDDNVFAMPSNLQDQMLDFLRKMTESKEATLVKQVC